jgi:hypothetical protein
MPISIAGSGTITGISAGGLPDDCITTADIAANAVTTAKLGSAEQSGLCKAWVNYDATGAIGTLTPRSSFNVSSVTKNAANDITVTFSTAMVDANYATFGTFGPVAGASNANCIRGFTSVTTTAVRFTTSNSASTDNFNQSSIAIFR